MDKINKLSLPATILIASVIFGGFYYAGQVNRQKSIEKQQRLDLEIKTKEIEIAKNQEPKVVEKPIYIEAKQNNDLTLVNFKIDMQDGRDLRNSLLEASNNSPSQMCSSVIAERTTKQHIYYMVLENNDNLKSKYGEYRASISYINNSLNGLDTVIQIVKDSCASLGYYF